MLSGGTIYLRHLMVVALAGIAIGIQGSSNAGVAQAAGPTNPDVAAARTLLDSWMGRSQILEKACSKLAAVLEVDPKDHWALEEMARCHLMQGYRFSTLTERDGEHFYRIRKYSRGTWPKAEALVNKALQLNPKFAEGYVLMASLNIDAGDLDLAEQNLVKAESLGTNSPWLHLHWATLYQSRGDYSALKEQANWVLAHENSDREAISIAYEFLADDLIREKKYAEASALFEKRIKLLPDSAWIRSNYAAFLTDTAGRHGEAINQAQKALSIMDHGIGRKVLAMALYRKWAELAVSGKRSKSSEYFAKAQQILPDLNFVMAAGAWTPAGEQLARALVREKGVSVDARSDGTTALSSAVEYGNYGAARWLLDLGADPNIANREEWPPLLVAIARNNLELSKLLLSKGANPNARVDQWSALSVAEHTGNPKLVGWVKEALQVQ